MSKEALINRYFNLQRLAEEGQPVDDALLETEQELYQMVEDEIGKKNEESKRLTWGEFWDLMASLGHWDQQLKQIRQNGNDNSSL